MADEVWVKYRGRVDLAPFGCKWIERSSLVKRLCYDGSRQYLLVNLRGTYYEYCGIPRATVRAWLDSDSMGRFYNQAVKGRFDCRGWPEERR